MAAFALDDVVGSVGVTGVKDEERKEDWRRNVRYRVEKSCCVSSRETSISWEQSSFLLFDNTSTL